MSSYNFVTLPVNLGSMPVSDTDPLDNGQDLGTPLGKILRIDPLDNNSTNGRYGIPADNPFVEDNDPKTLGEIWLTGRAGAETSDGIGF